MNPVDLYTAALRSFSLATVERGRVVAVVYCRLCGDGPVLARVYRTQTHGLVYAASSASWVRRDVVVGPTTFRDHESAERLASGRRSRAAGEAHSFDLLDFDTAVVREYQRRRGPAPLEPIFRESYTPDAPIANCRRHGTDGLNREALRDAALAQRGSKPAVITIH